jgi:hypothetical protein
MRKMCVAFSELTRAKRVFTTQNNIVLKYDRTYVERCSINMEKPKSNIALPTWQNLSQVPVFTLQTCQNLSQAWL